MYRQYLELNDMILKRIRSSLTLKLVLACIIVEVIMLCLLLLNSVRILNHATDEHAQTHLTEIPPLINTALAPLLFQRDFASINDFLNDLIVDDEHGISYIIIQDNSGQIYGKKGNVDLKNPPSPNYQMGDSTETHFRHSQIPLLLSGKKIGVVKYGISLKHLSETKDKLLYQGILIAFLEILFTIFLLSLIGYILTRHIRALVIKAKAISKGDYSIAIKTSGMDEIGILSNSFAEMAMKIQKQTTYLKESEKKYRSIFEESNDGIILHDLDGNIIDSNKKAQQLVGYNEDELRKIRVPVLHPESELETAKRAFEETKHIGHVNFETKFLRKDGSEIFVDISSRFIDFGEKLIQGIVRDITLRKEAEKNLKDILHFNEKIISESPVGISIYEADSGICIAANDSLAKIVGGTREKLLAQNFYELESWKKSGLLKTAKKVIKENKNDRKTIEVKSSFGKKLAIDCHFTQFNFGEKQHFLLTTIDITQKLKAEKAILEQKQTAERYLNLAGVMFVGLDTDGNINLVNQKASKILEWDNPNVLKNY